jgi:hypothetical protein
MKATMLAMALAMLGGCGHGLAEVGSGSNQDVRGSVQVVNEGRLLVAGPAWHVHASVDDGRPVSLFVVDAVKGDDRDCALTSSRHIALAPRAHTPARIPKGRELCAASSVSTEVLWHARIDAPGRALALQ